MNIENKQQTIRKVPCEIWSRVVGYFRPVNEWNKGQQEAFRERQEYDLEKINRGC